MYGVSLVSRLFYSSFLLLHPPFFFGMCMGLQGFKFSFPKGHNRCFYTELKASSNAWLSTKVTAKGW